jgi:hypothetical protein
LPGEAVSKLLSFWQEIRKDKNKIHIREDNRFFIMACKI